LKESLEKIETTLISLSRSALTIDMEFEKQDRSTRVNDLISAIFSDLTILKQGLKELQEWNEKYEQDLKEAGG